MEKTDENQLFCIIICVVCICVYVHYQGGGGEREKESTYHATHCKKSRIDRVEGELQFTKKITVSGNPYTYKLVRCTRHNNVHLEEAVPTTNNNDEYIPRLTIAVKM